MVTIVINIYYYLNKNMKVHSVALFQNYSLC